MAMTVLELAGALLEATPLPSAALSAIDCSTAAAALVAKRQPLLDQLTQLLEAGALLEPLARAQLEEVRRRDAVWRRALDEAQRAFSRQLVALKRAEQQLASKTGTLLVDFKT